MAWGWGERWDCFYLHLFYNRIQSLCCDRIRHQEVSRFDCFCCYCLHRPIWYILMWDRLDRNPLSCKCSIYLNIPCKRKVLILFSVLLDTFSALPYLLGVPKSIHHFRIDHNAPFLLPVPKFQFFLGILVVQREIEDNGYVNFWRVNKVHYGLCENHELPVVFCKVALT